MIGLETLNLLIILTMLPSKYQLSENKLKEYFGSLDTNSVTNDFYFRWITFMLYVGDRVEYQELRDLFIAKAHDYLLTCEDMFIDAEYFMFYFDYLACPYIEDSEKKDILEKVKGRTKFKSPWKVKQNTFNVLLNKDFIVSWRDPEYLKNSLEKKEYIFSYN